MAWPTIPQTYQIGREGMSPKRKEKPILIKSNNPTKARATRKRQGCEAVSVRMSVQTKCPNVQSCMDDEDEAKAMLGRKMRGGYKRASKTER